MQAPVGDRPCVAKLQKKLDYRWVNNDIQSKNKAEQNAEQSQIKHNYAKLHWLQQLFMIQ